VPKLGSTPTPTSRADAAIIERSPAIRNKLYWSSAARSRTDYTRRGSCGLRPNVRSVCCGAEGSGGDPGCIYAGDIARKKMRADFGIPYDVDALKLIDDLRRVGASVRRWPSPASEDQPSARVFKARSSAAGSRSIRTRRTRGTRPTWT